MIITETCNYALKRCLIVIILSLPSVSLAQYDFSDHNFSKPDSIALQIKDFDLDELDTIVLLLTRPLSNEVDKFRAIFRWVTENIDYDIDLYFKNEKKESKLRYNREKLGNWRKAYAKKHHRRLVRRQMAVCSGFAYLIEAMCQQAGIGVVTINGYGRTATSTIGRGKINHAWNAVQLNGKWYLCDATWSSGYYDPIRKKYTKQFDDTYFLTDPDYFLADHYPKDKSWTLIQNPIVLSEFLNGPIKLQGYHTNKMVRIEPKNGRFSGRAVRKQKFRFTANKPIDTEVSAYVVSKKWSDIETAKVVREADGYYSFELNFYQAGDCKVYISLNGTPSLLFQARIRD